MGRGIDGVNLIKHLRLAYQRTETVGEAGRHEKLFAAQARKPHPKPRLPCRNHGRRMTSRIQFLGSITPDNEGDRPAISSAASRIIVIRAAPQNWC
jgi:hypothetical protein